MLRGTIRALIVIGILMALTKVSIVHAQSAHPRITPEYKLKVAYLFNFTRYVQWPATAFEDFDTPFRIGVIGRDPFGAALDHVAKLKKAQNRRIVVQRFRSVKEYRPCQIVFVSKHVRPAELAAILKQTRQQPALVVCESSGLARRGATVNFFLDVDGTIGFEINVDAAQRNKLRINARLLKLARVVRDESPSKER